MTGKKWCLCLVAVLLMAMVVAVIFRSSAVRAERKGGTLVQRTEEASYG